MAPSSPSSPSSKRGISITKQNASSSSFPFNRSSCLIASILSFPRYSQALSQVSAWKMMVVPSVAPVSCLSSSRAASSINFAIDPFNPSSLLKQSQGIPFDPKDFARNSYFFSTSDLPISLGKTSAFTQGACWKTVKSDFFAQSVTSWKVKLSTLSSGLSIPYKSIASFQVRTGNGSDFIFLFG